jgi:hypothetical protein
VTVSGYQGGGGVRSVQGGGRLAGRRRRGWEGLEAARGAGLPFYGAQARAAACLAAAAMAARPDGPRRASGWAG